MIGRHKHLYIFRCDNQDVKEIIFPASLLAPCIEKHVFVLSRPKEKSKADSSSLRVFYATWFDFVLMQAEYRPNQVKVM